MLFDVKCFSWLWLQPFVWIHAHTHPKADIVVIYYPRVTLDDDCPDTSDHRGSLRIYDPANVGKRFWPINTDKFHIGGWHEVRPITGTMAIFEGYMLHSSSYFKGDERTAIPIMCDIITEDVHRKAPVSHLLAK